MSQAILVIGLLAAIFLMIAYSSQSIQTIKTRNTLGINPVMFFVVWLACVFFVIYGIMLVAQGAVGNGEIPNVTQIISGKEVAAKESSRLTGIIAGVPILISNTVVGTLCSIVFLIKFKNMYFAKKFKISEHEYYSKHVEPKILGK